MTALNRSKIYCLFAMLAFSLIQVTALAAESGWNYGLLLGKNDVDEQPHAVAASYYGDKQYYFRGIYYGGPKGLHYGVVSFPGELRAIGKTNPVVRVQKYANDWHQMIDTNDDPISSYVWHSNIDYVDEEQQKWQLIPPLRVASCVANDKLYVFWSINKMKQQIGSPRKDAVGEIWMKSTSTPEAEGGWENRKAVLVKELDHGVGSLSCAEYKTEDKDWLTVFYIPWKYEQAGYSPVCNTPAGCSGGPIHVLADKHDGDGFTEAADPVQPLRLKTFQGAPAGVGSEAFTAIAVRPVNDGKGNPVVLVAALHQNAILEMLSFDGQWHENTAENWNEKIGVTSLSRYAGQPAAFDLEEAPHIAMVPGTLSQNEKRAMQIFFRYGLGKKLNRNDIHRITYTIEGDHAIGGKFIDSGEVVNFDPGAYKDLTGGGATIVRGKEYWPQSFTAVPGYRDEDGDTRQYITVARFNSGRFFETSTRESDLFKTVSREPQEEDTGKQGAEQKADWLLLGVIEGVPPFTRNGNGPSSAPESRVVFKQSEDKKVSMDISWDISMGMLIGGEFSTGKGNPAIVAQASLGYGLGRKDGNVTSKNVTIERTFTNRENNADGKYGYLVIVKPHVQYYLYDHYSYDGEQRFDQTLVKEITRAGVDYEPYLLNQPDILGTPSRWPSSDPRAWKTGLGSKEGITVENEFLWCNLPTGTSGVRSACTFQEGSGKSKELYHTFNWGVKAGLKNRFVATLEGKLRTTESVRTEKGKYLSISIGGLPVPAPGDKKPIARLTTHAYWLMPNNHPYWVPKIYSGQKAWLLTWRVVNIEDAGPK